jgi:hypothetical protein
MIYMAYSITPDICSDKKHVFTSFRKAILIIPILLTAMLANVQAQTSSTDTTFKPSGKLWGLAFGDYYYKAHEDILNRGGANQYTNIEKGRNAFQFRRILLGYSYDITKQFTAEFVVAAEDNLANKQGVLSGDLLSNNKLSFYVRLANLRWKNIWKNTDLVVGQLTTPAFSHSSDAFWSYRAVERTITDIRRTPSFDLGAALQGSFDNDKKYGYNLMVGNGTSARPENDRFKAFSGDVYAKFLDKKLMIDLYADYQRLNWTPGFHHARNMTKLFAGYTTPALTVGVEAFLNHGKNDVIGHTETAADTISVNAFGISTFARGPIVQGKLGFFARLDKFNPDEDYNDSNYIRDEGLTSAYEPNNKETLIIAGLDFTPAKNIHFMPNLWYNSYTSQRDDVLGRAKKDHDLVYRVTFAYSFGK